MKKLTALLCFWFLLTGAVSFASGIQVDALIAGLRDPDTDNFLAGGLVCTYAAGTTASKSLYMDAAMTTASTNPVVLDAYGRALRFAKGKYKFVIKKSTGYVLWTLDNLEYDSVSTLASKTANPFGPTMSITNFSTPNLNATLSANLNANGYKITNVATPTSAYDVANMQYVASEVAYVASNTANSLILLASSVASLAFTLGAPADLGSTTLGFDATYLTLGSSSWISTVATNVVNTSSQDAIYMVTMEGSLNVQPSQTANALGAGCYIGMVDDLGRVYAYHQTGPSFYIAIDSGTATATSLTMGYTDIFTLSAFITVPPGTAKTLNLSYKDALNFGTGSGYIARATNGRWLNILRIK